MAIKIKKDGRVILSGKDYTQHKKEVWEAQGGRCGDCGEYIWFQSSQFHHARGRGIGGGKRDDFLPDNRVLCPKCHSQYIGPYKRVKP